MLCGKFKAFSLIVDFSFSHFDNDDYNDNGNDCQLLRSGYLGPETNADKTTENMFILPRISVFHSNLNISLVQMEFAHTFIFYLFNLCLLSFILMMLSLFSALTVTTWQTDPRAHNLRNTKRTNIYRNIFDKNISSFLVNIDFACMFVYGL